MRALSVAALSAAAIAAVATSGVPVAAADATTNPPTSGPGESFAITATMPFRVSDPAGRADKKTLLVKSRTTAPAEGKQTALPSPRQLADQVATVTGRPARPVVGAWVVVRTGGHCARTRRELQRDPSVARVTTDHVRHTYTNDPAFDRYQPYLRATMDFPQAWHRSSGAGVTVAVIDTGVDATHPDLGRVLPGHDFVQNDSTAADANGHGTFVSGIIAARRNNGRGVAGASRATILPVRVLNARGFGRDSDVASGIRWAVNHRADITNLSLGGAHTSPILHAAITYAERHGVLVVASSGNDGGTKRTFPAAYPSVVAVGATDTNDQVTWFSQRGPWVDLVAPGWNIVSTVPGNRYAIGSGTSFSAPLVSAAAALIIEQHPRWAPSKTRAELIRAAADAGPVGPDAFTGYGVIDVDGALGGTISPAAAASFGGDAVTPATARSLDRREQATLNPEGAGMWFVYDRSSTANVTFRASLHRSSKGVLRGDLALDVYDSNLHLIRHVDRWTGGRDERTTIRVSSAAYIRVSNRQPTRSPGTFVLRSDPVSSGGQATVGFGSKPMVLDASPLPNTVDVNSNADLSVTLGRSLDQASINPSRLRLIDGSSGRPVSRAVSYDAVSGVLTVNPDAPLVSQRDYSLVLRGLRSPQGRALPATSIGFRVL